MCNFSFLLVSWTVVRVAPAALCSLSEAMPKPQFGHEGAVLDTSLLHSGQLIKAIVDSFYFVEL